jgi:hypothetical protein
MGRPAIDQKDGRPGVRRNLAALERIAGECQRRADEKPGLEEAAAYARSVCDALIAADLAKEGAIAAAKEAHRELCSAYDDARLAIARLKSQLYGLYGVDGEALAAFGLRVPHTRKRLVELGTSTQTKEER